MVRNVIVHLLVVAGGQPEMVVHKCVMHWAFFR